jgi:hypothetical protein
LTAEGKRQSGRMHVPIPVLLIALAIEARLLTDQRGAERRAERRSGAMAPCRTI